MDRHIKGKFLFRFIKRCLILIFVSIIIGVYHCINCFTVEVWGKQSAGLQQPSKTESSSTFVFESD